MNSSKINKNRVQTHYYEFLNKSRQIQANLDQLHAINKFYLSVKERIAYLELEGIYISTTHYSMFPSI